MKLPVKKFHPDFISFFHHHHELILAVFAGMLFLGGIGGGVFLNLKLKELQAVSQEKKAVYAKLQKTTTAYLALKNQDQYKINQDLEAKIKSTDDTYTQTVSIYEKLLDLKTQVKDTKDMDSLFAETMNYLAKLNYSSASADLTVLDEKIQDEQNKLAAAAAAGVTNATASNALPGPGFSVQSVSTDIGTFTVKIVAADLNSTRVIVDTASDSDCSNNCPVLPLADYISRNGAFAGINGTFFCPVDYPSCAGKIGSFDTLLMNKNKTYFNSDNNKFSTVPLVVFFGNQMDVREHSEDWGRDTSVDSVIAMQPLYILHGNIYYDGGSGDPKYLNKGTRDFVAAKGNMVYIGTIYGADMRDAAHVLKTLGVDNALNLDEGGSTALWANGGYQAGPGRNIPNAVLFVHK